MTHEWMTVEKRNAAIIQMETQSLTHSISVALFSVSNIPLNWIRKEKGVN